MATSKKDTITQIQNLGGSTKGRAKELRTRLENIIEDAPLTFETIYKMNVKDLQQALKKRDANIHCDEKVSMTEKEDLQLQLFQCLLKRRGEYTQTNINDNNNNDEIDEYEEKKESIEIKPKNTLKPKRSSTKHKHKKNETETEPVRMYIVNETKLIQPFKFTIAASINSKVNLKIGKLNTLKNLQNAIKQLMEVKQMKKMQIIQSKVFDTLYLNEICNILKNKFQVSNISLSLQNIQIKTKKAVDCLFIKNGGSTLIADKSYIGALIICLPIRTFEGGQLIIDPHKGNSIISFSQWINGGDYDKDSKEFKSLYWAAIEKSYKYKLNDVSKGYRMTVEYGIHSMMDMTGHNDQVITTIKEQLVKGLVDEYTLLE